MNWTAFLKGNMEYTYSVTEKLLDRVTDDTLQWKPETGTNWMTVGQLLKHITGACGACCKGFVTGDWGTPEGVDYNELPPEEMLPPAEALPAVESVDEARRLLANLDKFREVVLDFRAVRSIGQGFADEVLARQVLQVYTERIGVEIDWTASEITDQEDERIVCTGVLATRNISESHTVLGEGTRTDERHRAGDGGGR